MFNKYLLCEIIKGLLLIISMPWIYPICDKWVIRIRGLAQLSQELWQVTRKGTREADQSPTLPLNRSGNVRLSERGVTSALVQKKSVCVFPTLPLSPDSLLLFFALEGSGGLVQLGHPKRTHTSLSCWASLLCLASKAFRTFGT